MSQIDKRSNSGFISLPLITLLVSVGFFLFATQNVLPNFAANEKQSRDLESFMAEKKMILGNSDACRSFFQNKSLGQIRDGKWEIPTKTTAQYSPQSLSSISYSAKYSYSAGSQSVQSTQEILSAFYDLQNDSRATQISELSFAQIGAFTDQSYLFEMRIEAKSSNAEIFSKKIIIPIYMKFDKSSLRECHATSYAKSGKTFEEELCKTLYRDGSYDPSFHRCAGERYNNEDSI